MPAYDVNNLLIKPVYGIDNYGEDITIPFGQDAGLTLTDITPSTATFDQDSPSSTVFHIEDIDTIISNIDTLPIAHEGNNTAFNRIYEWTPDMSAFIYKGNIFCAFGLNVSAYTSGNFNIDSIRIIITNHLQDGTLIKTLVDKTINTSLSALTATGTQIFIMNLELLNPTKITNATPVRIQIIINETTGTGTRQVGILPLFCFNSQATNKIFTQSVFKMHLHASLDHMYPVFRSQTVTQEMDYAGVESSGVKR